MVQGMGLGDNRNNRRSKEDIERSRRNRERLIQSAEKAPTKVRKKSRKQKHTKKAKLPYKNMLLAGLSGFIIVVVLVFGYRYFSQRNAIDPGMIKFPDETINEVVEDIDGDEISPEYEQALIVATEHAESNPYSKAGLKDQMIEEAFDTEAIEFAISQLDVDWASQAVLAGERYVEFTDSDATIKGLREQLGYEKFTAKEINHAVDQIGIEK